MKRSLSKIMVGLLVPALALDPVWAGGFQLPATHVGSTRPQASLYGAMALSARALGSHSPVGVNLSHFPFLAILWRTYASLFSPRMVPPDDVVVPAHQNPLLRQPPVDPKGLAQVLEGMDRFVATSSLARDYMHLSVLRLRFLHLLGLLASQTRVFNIPAGGDWFPGLYGSEMWVVDQRLSEEESRSFFDRFLDRHGRSFPPIRNLGPVHYRQMDLWKEQGDADWVTEMRAGDVLYLKFAVEADAHWAIARERSSGTGKKDYVRRAWEARSRQSFARLLERLPAGVLIVVYEWETHEFPEGYFAELVQNGVLEEPLQDWLTPDQRRQFDRVNRDPDVLKGRTFSVDMKSSDEPDVQLYEGGKLSLYRRRPAEEKISTHQKIIVPVRSWAAAYGAVTVLHALRASGLEAPVEIIIWAFSQATALHRLMPLFDSLKNVSLTEDLGLLNAPALLRIRFDEGSLDFGLETTGLGTRVAVPLQFVKTSLMPVSVSAVEALRLDLALVPEEQVIVLASSHDFSEADAEGITFLRAAINARVQLHAHPPRILLVPRWPLVDHDRRLIDEIAHDAGLTVSERQIRGDEKSILQGSPEAPILILNTEGELRTVYALSDVAVVGNTFRPYWDGHNVLEPVVLGCPVLFGPGVKANQRLASFVLEQGVGVQLTSAKHLEDQLVAWLGDASALAAVKARTRVARRIFEDRLTSSWEHFFRGADALRRLSRSA